VITSIKIKWTRHIAHLGEARDAYGVLVGKPEGQRDLGTLELVWNNIIKVGLQDVV
jgi:hypothetical protein